LDAERAISANLLETLKGMDKGVKVLALVGHAGSGKSTTLRRAAFDLAASGRAVYVSKTPDLLERRVLLNFISALGDRHAYLIVDDAGAQLNVLDEIVAALGKHSNITFVLSDRPHILLPRLQRTRYLQPVTYEMPALSREECERILDKLDEFGVLGDLRGKSRTDQLRQFLGRSKKQLLVAMKEATSGRGFDAILTHEFNTLSGENARLAYLIACMAYMHGAPVRRRHLLACLAARGASS
jgi:hypothetical protein